jgi:hypothetical protein
MKMSITIGDLALVTIAIVLVICAISDSVNL